MSRRPAVRVREPKREGQEIVFVVAEDSLPLSHPARLLWTALGDFDLSAFVDDAKGSTTDPDARLMRMDDGSIAPAHNFQFATLGDPAGGPVAIVGVLVTSAGNDKGSLLPMRATVGELTGHTPDEVLADPDHVTLDDLRLASAEGFTIVSRVPERWTPEGKGQDDVTRAWMLQVETEESKAVYRGRKALAERPNAILKDTFHLRSPDGARARTGRMRGVADRCDDHAPRAPQTLAELSAISRPRESSALVSAPPSAHPPAHSVTARLPRRPMPSSTRASQHSDATTRGHLRSHSSAGLSAGASSARRSMKRT